MGGEIPRYKLYCQLPARRVQREFWIHEADYDGAPSRWICQLQVRVESAFSAVYVASVADCGNDNDYLTNGRQVGSCGWKAAIWASNGAVHASYHVFGSRENLDRLASVYH